MVDRRSWIMMVYLLSVSTLLSPSPLAADGTVQFRMFFSK